LFKTAASCSISFKAFSKGSEASSLDFEEDAEDFSDFFFLLLVFFFFSSLLTILSIKGNLN